MSEPSSQDEDTLVVRLAHIDIRQGSSAPGPAPNANEILDDLIDEALDLKLPVNPAPPQYGAYVVNFFLSEYDAGTDGPADSSEKPRFVRVDGGWRCPILPAHERAYKGCVLYGVRFPNVGILGLHLSRHHSDVETHWRGVQVRKVHIFIATSLWYSYCVLSARYRREKYPSCISTLARPNQR